MTKSEKIVILLSAKHQIERHKDFSKILAKLIINDIFALLGESDIKQMDQEKPHIKGLLNDLAFLLAHEQIKGRHAKEILKDAWETEYYDWDISHYILEKKMFDELPLDAIIEEVIAEQAQAWEEFASGKDKAIGRLTGAVMKKTKGKADPEEAQKLFRQKRG